MTVQEIGDEFTVLSHQGKAQTKVVHVSGSEVKNVTGIEMIGDDIALIKSERSENNEAESAAIINEKLKIDVAKFVEKKNPDYKKDVIKHQTLRSLLIEFTAKREEELKANFDYILEGKDLEIKTLGERCNQLLKDKGDLTDRVSNQAESLRITMLEEEKKGKRITELEEQIVQLRKDVIENESDCANCGLRQENEELKKEVLEVRQHLELTEREWGKDTVKLILFKTQLTKAKELLKEAQGYIENIDDILYDEIEQFLKEIEK